MCQNCYENVPPQDKVGSGDFKPATSTSQLPHSSTSSQKSAVIRFRPYDMEKSKVNSIKLQASESPLKMNPTASSTLNDGKSNTSEERVAPMMGTHSYRCYICSNLYSRTQMEWLSTSAEGMNSHAMHFPCLRTLVR